MQTSKHSGFLAQVRAKDDEDDAMAQLRVTSETTVGELLRFYRWRQDDHGGYDIGFTIDLSPAGKPEVKRRSSGSAGSAEAAEIPSKKLRVAEEAASEIRAESSGKQVEAVFVANEADSRKERDELVKIATSVPKGKKEGVRAATGSGADMSQHNEPSSVKIEGSGSFNVIVSFDWIGDISVRVKPKTSIKKICYAACDQLKVDFSSVRSMFDGLMINMADSNRVFDPDGFKEGERTLLIRDPNATTITAQDWKLQEGDRIVAYLCQCGC